MLDLVAVALVHRSFQDATATAMRTRVVMSGPDSAGMRMAAVFGGEGGGSAPGSVAGMVRPLGLPFDPIERAGQTWEQHFGPAAAMRAATSIFRVQQILLARFDEALRPHDLTFARYEVLVLLTFSRTGELPLKVIGSRLMVHPTSVTNAIDRLTAAGYVRRRPNPADGRGVLAGITGAGRAVVEQATAALTDMDFALQDVPPDELSTLFDILRRVRLGAGDVAGSAVTGEGPEPSIDER